MSAELPLTDVKVCDLMWVMAGPAATRTLADFGAKVIRIETPSRPDPARGVLPHVRDVPLPDSSTLWNNNNAGKLGLSLDLSKPGAREVFLDLVRWADVVTESFSPGTMESWGLGYAALVSANPGIIVLSTCLMGQSGPHAGLAGFGNLSAGVTGFYGLCGWEDRPPSGPFGAYTDYIAPRYVVLAVLAALDYRRRTGRGQHIDLAQAETAVHFLAPAIIDVEAQAGSWSAVDNLDVQYAPHGVYATAQDGRWIAIACRTDAHWADLCAAIDAPEMVADERFSSLAARVRNRSPLEEILRERVGRASGDALHDALRRLRVPASLVQDSRACLEDPQLRAQGHFVRVEHPVVGEVVVEGPRFGLSRTPGRVQRAAPVFGEHDELVLSTILGYDSDHIRRLRDDAVIATGS